MPERLYHYKAIVKHWVDGDTVDLIVDLGFRTLIDTRFRLYGIDTPERGQEGYREATQFCAEHMAVGEEFIIRTYKNPDKYGRWLVELFLSDDGEQTINLELVNQGLAVPYFGGTKPSS